MTAPPEKTLKDLSGQWIMNKSLSDDIDSILQMQGIGWFLRKAISIATITLTITEYITNSVTHIDIQQVATGGIKGTEEKRTLDWTWRDHEDGIFGKLNGRSRWIKLSDLSAGEGTVESDIPFLTKGWEGAMSDEHVQSYVKSNSNGWTANQIWGFETIDGKRMHVRHVVVRKGEEWKQARLVYDWHGSSAAQENEEDGLAYDE